MPNHQKPTAEELEESIRKNQEEIDKQEQETTDDDSTDDPKEEENEEEVVEEAEDSEDKEEEEDKEKPAEEKSAEKPQETQEEIDYKKKFVASTREAQVLNAKDKKWNETIDKAAKLPEPTDEELQQEYPEWAEMSATERKLAKDNLINKKRFAMLDAVAQESRNIEAWNQKVDTFIEDPKTLVDNPELEGKQEDFKIFATKATRRGVDFNDLVLAFFGEAAKNAKPKQKGQMFERGTGGPNDAPKPKSDKLSVEEADRLMRTDYKKWRQLLSEGKLASQ